MMKACGGVDGYLHSFLTSVLGKGEWSVLLPGCFTPGIEPFGPNTRSGRFLRRDKSFAPVRIRTSDRPACSLVTVLTV